MGGGDRGVPPAGLLEEPEGLHLREHVQRVVGGVAVGPYGHVHPVLNELWNRRNASGGELHVGYRAGGDGHPGLPHHPDLPHGEPCGMGGNRPGPQDPYVVQPLARPLAGLLLVVVDLAPGLGKMKVHGGPDLVGELLGADAGLLSADVDPLKAHAGDDLPPPLVLRMEPLAVVQRIPDLGGRLLVQDAPAQDAPDPRLLGGLGDDVFRIIEVHERRGASAHHLHASQLGPDGEVPVRPVGIDLEHLIEKIREGQVVHDAFHDRHGHVGVGVYHAGHHDVAGGVDLPVGGAVILRPDGDDPLVLDHEVPSDHASAGVLSDYPSVTNRGYHACES